MPFQHNSAPAVTMAVMVENPVFKKNIVLAVWRRGTGSCMSMCKAIRGQARNPRRSAIASLVHDTFISGLGSAAR
jgi:hypothetical protein